MAQELQDLRDLVEQLRVENDDLRRDRNAAQAGPSSRSRAEDCMAPERLVYLPRERRCPVFRGSHGIGLDEWIEEVQVSMNMRHLGSHDRAFFIYDHLEGEARDEIKYRPRAEREDPDRVLEILKELYGCPKSYISLQKDFFSRKQLDGESLQEFSHALYCLMEKIVANSPTRVHNSALLLRDHFVEHVSSPDLRRELKRLVRRNPDLTLLDVRAEAIRWEREGGSAGVRSHQASAHCTTQSATSLPPVASTTAEVTAAQLAALTALVQKQQQQLDQISQTLAAMQQPRVSQFDPANIICRRCRKPGHYARDCENERVRPRGTHISASQVTLADPQPLGNEHPLVYRATH